MADIMSILSTGYVQANLNSASSKPYTNVDPEAYEGRWEGSYTNSKKFKFTISQVNGFRAQVRYESEGTIKFQSVLIRDNSFRVGDSKFILAGNNKASIRTAVTDPVTNQTSLVTGKAVRS
ncbi:hypothetical protein BJ122_1174 [Rhodopseudomonas faecalis]|uniref:Uncharacterized protein n=1 Tax=Rhodopseudomonas faecalis TaxID=99655 RepID=A0A318T9Y8_9BRAD|nr:hypothetical protein [Rhodopseudomonas faecalis]PYF01781.1 hypothetical protein BJ122_1174 [Rhodopseudomonas faecalis]TAH65700.1 MAG: hypothetical protein EWM45_14140 [Rhodopseudomonas palustris]